MSTQCTTRTLQLRVAPQYGTCLLEQPHAPLLCVCGPLTPEAAIHRKWPPADLRGKNKAAAAAEVRPSGPLLPLVWTPPIGRLLSIVVVELLA